MKCLQADEIYLYLEEELAPSERQNVEEHLALCAKCRNAVRERKALHQASESLSLWETPQEFTGQVMAQIFFPKVTFRDWLVATAVGFSSIILTMLAFFMLTRESILEVMISFGHSVLELFRSSSVFFIKVFKLASLLIRVIVQLFEFFIQTIIRFTSILSPEAQIILVVLTIIVTTGLFFGVGRKLMPEKKT
ncbi:MAG: anti-sigma factor family protein [Candidatus Aminicenantales bacterium]